MVLTGYHTSFFSDNESGFTALSCVIDRDLCRSSPFFQSDKVYLWEKTNISSIIKGKERVQEHRCSTNSGVLKGIN